MDVRLRDIQEHTQAFIRKLISINDWVFYESKMMSMDPDVAATVPAISIGHVLRCFGYNQQGEENLSASPAKGPHACGTLQGKLADAVQFKLGRSSIQMYFTPSIEIWYLVNRGITHNAVKLTTFDRIGVVLANGRHRGIRHIIMSDDTIDLMMSDNTNDKITLRVVN